MNGNTFGDGDLVPRALVERLLEPEDPFSVGSDRPRLFVGRLPQGLPVDLVVPEGFEVLGGRIVSEEPRGEDGLEVVLDASMPASEALDAYRARLLSDGWSEPERREMRHGGFGVRPAGEPALFCRSERGPALFLRARDRRDDRTDVRLTLITSTRHSPCSPRAREPFFEPVIPDLSPPPDSRLFPQGGGDSDDSAHFAATLETTRSRFHKLALRRPTRGSRLDPPGHGRRRPPNLELLDLPRRRRPAVVRPLARDTATGDAAPAPPPATRKPNTRSSITRPTPGRNGA